MPRRGIALAIAAVIALGGAGVWRLAIARARFVRDEGGARWLVAETMRWPGVYPMTPRAVGFRRLFRIDSPTAAAELSLRAVERAAVTLDGKSIHVDTEPDPNGRLTRRVPLGALQPGEHVLAIYVSSTVSPPLLWARCDAIPIA